MTIPTKHERQALREAIVAQLTGTGPSYRTAAGARVGKSRIEPSKVATLPRIEVYSAEESTESDVSTLLKRRACNVEIVGWVEIPENVGELDDTLDALALEIEAAMDLDPHLDETAVSTRYLNTVLAMSEEGKRPLGAVSITYECVYETRPRVVEPPDAFDELTAETNLGGVQAVADRSHVSILDINQE